MGFYGLMRWKCSAIPAQTSSYSATQPVMIDHHHADNYSQRTACRILTRDILIWDSHQQRRLRVYIQQPTRMFPWSTFIRPTSIVINPRSPTPSNQADHSSWLLVEVGKYLSRGIQTMWLLIMVESGELLAIVVIRKKTPRS
jgi:hypothetical protein